MAIADGRPKVPSDFSSEPVVNKQDSLTRIESFDPVVGMLLRGEASSVHEAEERYLDSHLHEIVELAGSSLSDEEFRRHPLIVMLLAHGSRGFEDSLL